VLHGRVELTLHELLQSSVLYIAGKAQSDLEQEDDHGENGKAQYHAAALLQGSTASQEADHGYGGADNHQYNGSGPDVIAHEVRIVSIVQLHHSPHQEDEKSGKLGKVKDMFCKYIYRVFLNTVV